MYEEEREEGREEEEKEEEEREEEEREETRCKKDEGTEIVSQKCVWGPVGLWTVERHTGYINKSGC